MTQVGPARRRSQHDRKGPCAFAIDGVASEFPPFAGQLGGRPIYASSVAKDELFTVKQVAQELGMANTRVMSLIRRGHMVAASRPAGPATWRISRTELDAYIQRTRAEEVALQLRRRSKRLKELTDAWGSLSEQERHRLERELPRDLFVPLARLMESNGCSRNADIEALSDAYRRRSDAGVEELALDMPHDLFWALARIGLNPA
jgi:excisionase family DNA binding protein